MTWQLILVGRPIAAFSHGRGRIEQVDTIEKAAASPAARLEGEAVERTGVFRSPSGVVGKVRICDLTAAEK